MAHSNPSVPTPPIPRDEVHRLAEACSDEGDAFQPTATRLIKDQRRLSRYIEQNVQHLGPLPAQVALYMLTVTMRIFEQVGGRMSKVATRDIDLAAARISAQADALLPADAGFAERAKTVAWRAQPHILDEILWALFERSDEEKKEGEVDLPTEEGALVYLVMWLAVESLAANWQPPKGYGA